MGYYADKAQKEFDKEYKARKAQAKALAATRPWKNRDLKTDIELRRFYIKKLNEVPDIVSGEFETVFPLFLKDDITENFSPAWDEDTMFGRVDSIARYSNTKRTITFSFYVLALKGNLLGPVKKKFGLASVASGAFDQLGGLSAVASTIKSGELPDTDYLKSKGVDYLQGLKSNLMYKSFTDYHLFDNEDTCLHKIEFLRSLTYPKYDNGVYTQPPMIQISLTNQFYAVQGYITDLSITHQVVSGIGVDLQWDILVPHAWEISISLTILHSEPPTTEGPVF
jgi:hypothetical protein